jgi:hypothetical protein
MITNKGKKMLNILKYSLSILLLALITSCGGGGENSSSQNLYGAIAIRVGGLESGVVGGQNTQSDANTLALNRCGSNCEIKEIFVGNKCGGTAYSTGARVMAWAVGDSENAADNQAMLNCANSGGTNCTIYRGACNVSTQSSGTSGGVCTGSGTTFNCQGRVCTKSGNGVICSDGQYCPIPQNLSVTSNPVCASRN